MNKYLYLIIMWLCSLSVFPQTDGYDPQNPPLPNFPKEEEPEQDTTRYYTLVVNSSPSGSGSINTSGGKYVENASVYLRAYNNGNLYFMYWIDDEGNTLTTSSSFYYTMPKRDAVVTAVYSYNPANPGIPDFPEEEVKVPTYLLKIDTKPAGAGSFNTNSTYLKENESVHLYAYTNSNFYFQHWEDAEGNIISTAQNFYYTMPAVETQLYGIYKYNPANPGNPGKNAYDSFTGEVIVDDFTPGNLSRAISDVTNGNTSNITKITVAGKVNSNDFSIANNYSACTIVDLSRTAGIHTVPSYCYSGNSHINRLLLPASITTIESRAFNNASSLTELTCYSPVPPTLGSYVFNGVTSGLIVYVPASSVELYENADIWKAYIENGTIIIMPVRNEVASLEVNLPSECADGRYKNMPLELLNIKSGQKYKYVVTDRINYIFNNLVKGTKYVAYLKNLSGSVLAKSDTLSIDDDNVIYDFPLESMKQLRTVTANIMSPTGTDVTSQCTINWFDANGTFLSQGASLSGQVSETSVKCSVALPQSLAMQYVMPADSEYEVVEGNNTLSIALAALPKVTLSGTVVDKTTQLALSGASVTVSQTLNGKYSKAFTTKTDSKGEYRIQVFAAPSSLTFAASDYISQTAELSDSILSLAHATLGTVQLKSITGATITTNYTYTTSVAETVVPEVQNYYSDYGNVTYSIRNVTEGRDITQFNVQYPEIVLLEEVGEGDSLTIVAKSRNAAFMDITTGGRIDGSNRMSVTFPVVQFGGIDATFTTTENSQVLGILYDSKGAFVSKHSYNSSTLSLRELKDGEYTLVTMGESDFFGSIFNIDKFTEAGLQQNIDYLVNKIKVRSGIITPVKNVLVPFFDESKFYYTGENTSFTANKTSIVAGNYLTLTAKVDFKDVYKSNVSDVSIVVELPEGTTFVDNSVMVGSAVAYYELNGNTLTIPLDNNVSADRVRFCVIPTQSGSYSPGAAVAFKLSEKSISQPIGNAACTVKDIAINVPSEVNSTEVAVTGIAVGGSQITLYANGDVVGSTRALANGFWSQQFELPKPFNLKEYDIYARTETKTGMVINTETKTCLYNKDKVVAKSVEMSFYNGWMKKNIVVNFDLEKQTSDATSYSFYSETDFTFAVDLSNNNPDIVKNVIIRVYTTRQQWVNLMASYDQKTKKWIAVQKFGSDLPIGVKVAVYAATDIYADRDQIDENNDAVNRLYEENESLKMAVDSLNAENLAIEEKAASDSLAISNILSQLDSATPDEALELTREYLSANGIDDDSAPFTFDTLDELLANGEALLADDSDIVSYDELLAEADSLLNEEGNIDYSEIFTSKSDTISFVDANGKRFYFARTHRSAINWEDWASADTISIATTGGDSILAFQAGENFAILDEKTDSVWVLAVDVEFVNGQMRFTPRRISGQDIVKSLEDAIISVPSIFNRIREIIEALAEPLKKEIESLQKQMDNVSDAISELTAKSAAKGMKVRDIDRQIIAIENQLKNGLGNPASAEYQRLIAQRAALESQRRVLWGEIDQLGRQKCDLFSKYNKLKSSKLVKGAALSEILSYIELARGIYKIIDYAQYGIRDYWKWWKFVNSILPCDADHAKAVALKNLSTSQMNKAGGGYLSAVGLSGLASGINGFMMFSPTGKAAKWIAKTVVSMVTSFIEDVADKIFKETKSTSAKNYLARNNDKSKLKCACKCNLGKQCTCPPDKCTCLICQTCKCSEGGECNCDGECTCTPPEPTINPIHDPSGYVYEGVSSNRLQGVTATCYYKETVEDMYGDLHEEIVLWDAEEYAQKNPLFTDENGMYAWDVPQGLWKVKFDKEGYVPAESEWLPVPPPQMDVNIGMVQNSQPEVVSARAYEDGVEVEFSKYMNIETLTKENIYVKVVKDEEESLISDAEIELLNKEVTIAGNETEYASKVKVATDQLGYYDEAYLIVSTGVNSYAGVPMAQTFEQKLDVEKKVRELLVETEFNVEYDGQREVIIAATPADAAVGKKLSVLTASEKIAATDVAEVTFDADGQAKFTVSGELYGTTALNYSLLDADLKATSLVNVVDPVKLEAVKAPIASRMSGTAVYRGQTVTLTCESEGATIYYTTDGSCPCDDAKRIKYERPIAINDSMTIKFMSIGTNFDESEVKECTYSIRQSDVKLSLAKGWNWSSHDMASPVSVDEFAGVASRIVTQADEVVDDPVLGLVGSLTSINSGETMKIEAKDATVKAFTGEQYNPALSPIVLHEGWNWLGYPISQTMTVGDALSYMDSEEGDCISNLENGFATYSNGNWEGTLETLTPGYGYLYKSASSKSFIYNNVPTVANAKAIYGHRLVSSPAPWMVDKHRYPNMMSVIGQVCYADGLAADSTYYIGAFVGDECRGVGKYKDGVIYLSVYGDNTATVTFKAWNTDSESLSSLSETLPFSADVIGTSHEPFLFRLGYQPTGIERIGNSYGIDGIYNLQGVKMNSIANRGIYIIKTTDANGNSMIKKQYVK